MPRRKCLHDFGRDWASCTCGRGVDVRRLGEETAMKRTKREAEGRPIRLEAARTPTLWSADAAWLGRIPASSGRAKVGRFGVYSSRESAARRLRFVAYCRMFSTGVDFRGVLITQRSKVQILPPQPRISNAGGRLPAFIFFRSERI